MLLRYWVIKNFYQNTIFLQFFLLQKLFITIAAKRNSSNVFMS